MSETEKELRDLVGKIARADASTIGTDDDLMGVLGLDSLAALRLLAAVEKKYGIRFPDDRLAEFRTLRRILEKINHSGGASPK